MIEISHQTQPDLNQPTLNGGAENARPENARPENARPNCMTWKCMMWKCKTWKCTTWNCRTETCKTWNAGKLYVLLKMPDIKLLEFFSAVAQGPGSLHYTAHQSNSGGTSPNVGWKTRESVQRGTCSTASLKRSSVEPKLLQRVYRNSCTAYRSLMRRFLSLSSVLLLKHLWLTF